VSRTEVGRYETQSIRIRTLIVVESELLCSLIATVLEDEPDIEVSGYATTVEEAASQATQSDVVLIHARLPGNDSLKLTRILTQTEPDVKVVVVGLVEIAPLILEYVEAGAAGYVLDDDSADGLLTQIRAAARDLAVISPQTATVLMSHLYKLATALPRNGLHPSPGPDLTPREQEVLALIGQGMNNAEMAEQLVVAVGTVKNHVHNLYRKLEVNNRQDAAAYYRALRPVWS
jgi:two-component system response regulator DevR